MKTILAGLRSFPVVALLGPRQVGKTTLALALAGTIARDSLYFDLERDSDQNKLNEAELNLRQHRGKLVILDEIQRRPDFYATPH